MTQQTSNPFVICDDDIFYPSDWYESLIREDDQASYVAHNCHAVGYDEVNNQILPYHRWEKSIKEGGQISQGIFAVGCGGTLIYPDRIGAKFKDWQLINKLCPKSDDIWLKMAHLEKQIPGKNTNYFFPIIEYLDTQSVSLMNTNVNQNQNDLQIKNVVEYFDIDMRPLKVNV
jgi:hypothetical protein